MENKLYPYLPQPSEQLHGSPQIHTMFRLIPPIIPLVTTNGVFQKPQNMALSHESQQGKPTVNSCGNNQGHQHSQGQNKQSSQTKQQISEKIPNASVEIASNLRQGLILNKYCYNIFKIQQTILTLSDDLKFISLYNKQKKELKVISIKNCHYEEGLKTQRFQQYLKRHYLIVEGVCFSLKLQERTYDFAVSTKEKRDLITDLFRGKCLFLN